MNKIEKEKHLFQVRLKEIEAIDRDTTALVYKILGGLGAISAFLYVNKLINKDNILILIAVFIYICFYNDYILTRYIHDCYEGLFNSIKNNKLMIYKIPRLKWYNIFYYKKKY